MYLCTLICVYMENFYTLEFFNNFLFLMSIVCVVIFVS